MPIWIDWNVVHHEGFHFCKDKAAIEVLYFRCTDYKERCDGARLTLRRGIVINATGDYNHEPLDDTIHDDNFVQGLRDQSRNNTTQSTCNVFSTVVQMPMYLFNPITDQLNI